MLCSKYNLTLLIHIVNFNSMLDVDERNNKLIGELLQKLIDVKSDKSDCKLIPVKKDIKCVNDSCSQIDPINLLAEDDKFDMFFRREHPFVTNDKILLSNVAGYEYTILTQALDTYDKKIDEKFFQEMFSDTVQFDQVIVDTSKLIITKEDILTTTRKICWIKDEKDIYFFENSNDKFMNKIWKTKNYDPICKFVPSIFDPRSNRFLNVFIFSKQFVVNLLASFVPQFFRLNMWVNPKPFFEFFTVYYLRRSLEKEKVIFINKISTNYFEFGLIDVTKILGSKIFRYDKRKVIFDLKQFVDQNTKFSKLNLKRLESIFYFYLILNLIIIIIFIVNMINRKI